MCNIRTRTLWTIVGLTWLGFALASNYRNEQQKQRTHSNQGCLSFFRSKLFIFQHIFVFFWRKKTFLWFLVRMKNICITEQILGIWTVLFLFLFHSLSLSLCFFRPLLLISNSQETSLQMVTLLRDLRKWSVACKWAYTWMWQPKNQTRTSNIQVNQNVARKHSLLVHLCRTYHEISSIYFDDNRRNACMCVYACMGNSTKLENPASWSVT